MAITQSMRIHPGSRPDGKISPLPRNMAVEYRRIIGQFLCDRRRELGLTQKALAYALGIGNTAVSAIETGRNTPAPSKYDALADLLEIDRKDFANFLLRYTNPHLYALLYGRHDATLQADLLTIEQHSEEAHLPSRTKGR